MATEFHVGDIVRDKRFNVPRSGKVIVVDNAAQCLVIESKKGNYSVPMHIMEIMLPINKQNQTNLK